MTRWLLLALTMGCLLIPRGGLSGFAAAILAVPVAFTGVLNRDRTFRWWSTYVVGFVCFALVRDLADEVAPVFFQYPIWIDGLLGFGQVPTVFLQQWYHPGAPRPWDWIAIGVYLTHFVAFPIIGVLLWRQRARQLRPFLLGMTAVLAVSALVHLVAATAPPWVASQEGLLPMVYKPVTEILDGYAPGMYAYGLSVAGGNHVAAMPSVHTAAAAMITLASWRTRWSLAGVAYLVAMGLALVYLGEHYVIDIAAGAGLAIAAWWWVSRGARDPGPVPDAGPA